MRVNNEWLQSDTLMIILEVSSYSNKVHHLNSTPVFQASYLPRYEVQLSIGIIHLYMMLMEIVLRSPHKKFDNAHRS